MKTHIARLLTIIGRPQFVIPGMILAAFLCFLPKTEVKAEVIDDNTAVFWWGTLSFGQALEDYDISIPFPVALAADSEGHWLLSGFDTEYKNEILIDYQNRLTAIGVPRDELRWYAAQLCAENCAFDPTRLGDYVKDGQWCKKIVKGCRPLSFGLIQYNSWAKHGLLADTFLQKNPEWKTIDKQLDWMIEQVENRRAAYGNDIRRIMLDHNAPGLAAKGYTDSKAGYVKKIQKNMAALSLSTL